MKIVTATDRLLLKQADELLYQVLWQPYGLPRDLRSRFEVEGEEITFAALDEGRVIGTLILIYGGEAAEIRHLAVLAENQRLGVGTGLISAALDYSKKQGIKQIEVYGRDTAISFWEKLGFVDTSGWLDHDFFVRHRIRFKRMVKDV